MYILCGFKSLFACTYRLAYELNVHQILCTFVLSSCIGTDLITVITACFVCVIEAHCYVVIVELLSLTKVYVTETFNNCGVVELDEGLCD